MDIKIELITSWNNIEVVLNDLQNFEGIQQVDCLEKRPLENSILDRKPNNQVELFEVVLNIVFSIASEEAYKYLKDKIAKYLSEKKINSSIKGKSKKKNSKV